jgi:predicted ABC-type ATPase
VTTDLRPVLVIVAGPNGSGKTTLTERVLQHEWLAGCVYINPDNIAKDVFGDWNSEKAVLQAANLAQAERERCLRERRSMAFETVFSAPDKLDFVRRAKEAGFFVRLFFVGTDSPMINVARVANRVMAGGHGVPSAKIVERYAKSIANCIGACLIVDRAYIYDNSVDEQKPRLLFRIVHGQIHKVYWPPNAWTASILKALPLAPSSPQ